MGQNYVDLCKGIINNSTLSEARRPLAYLNANFLFKILPGVWDTERFLNHRCSIKCIALPIVH